MLPLAAIVRAGGARVAGSDRSLDAGRLAQKFDYLRSLGIALAPQDGSGLGEGMTLVTSAAVEDTHSRCRPGTRAGPRPPDPAAAAGEAAQRCADEHRRRRDQRQIDRDRDDRLDPSRAAPPADRDERRGDEEFRLARSALRLGAGRRSRTVRQRSRRKRRLDRALSSDASPCSAISASTIRTMDELRACSAGSLAPLEQGGGQSRRPGSAAARRRDAGGQADRLSASTARPRRCIGRNLELLPDGVRIHGRSSATMRQEVELQRSGPAQCDECACRARRRPRPWHSARRSRAPPWPASPVSSAGWKRSALPAA